LNLSGGKTFILSHKKVVAECFLIHRLHYAIPQIIRIPFQRTVDFTTLTLEITKTFSIITQVHGTLSPKFMVHYHPSSWYIIQSSWYIITQVHGTLSPKFMVHYTKFMVHYHPSSWYIITQVHGTLYQVHGTLSPKFMVLSIHLSTNDLTFRLTNTSS